MYLFITWMSTWLCGRGNPLLKKNVKTAWDDFEITVVRAGIGYAGG
jgi:hypothetical protein